MATQAFTLMQFNIEYGGTWVDFDANVRAIEQCGADVVAIQEGCGNMQRIADALGWAYVDNRSQVVSRFPLLNPPDARYGVIYVELEPGRVIALINVHPSSRSFGPIRMGKGIAPERVIERERVVRLAELQPSIDVAKDLMSQGIPVILLGDFNAPSHRDWVPETVRSRRHVLAPMNWPTSVACEEAGLVDVYRQHFPDPVTHPGLTWPADRPFVKGYNPVKRGAPDDRIDLMFASPGVGATSIAIMGEPSEFTDLVMDPWPSDHRALVAGISVEPQPPSPCVSASVRRGVAQSPFDVRFMAAGAGATTISVDDREWSVRGDQGVVNGVSLPAGRHDILLLAGDKELARTTVWIVAPESAPTIGTDRSSYAVGEEITVSWRGSPGNRFDWIAVFRAGDDPQTARRVTRASTATQVDGEVVLNESVRPGTWPIPPGDYDVYLLLDDLRVVLATGHFSVR